MAALRLQSYIMQLGKQAGNGPLARYVKLRVRMRRECRESFPRHRR